MAGEQNTDGRVLDHRGADHLELSVLGPVGLCRGGRPVEIGSAKQRCLLGLLAVQPNHVVGIGELVDALWDDPPPTAHDLVHTYVARLRRTLRPSASAALATVGGGYRLDTARVRLDLAEFDELTARALQAQAARPAAALELLGRAVGSCRGPVLADLTGRIRLHPAVVAVGHRRLAAVLAFADLAVELGEYARAVARLREISYEEPLHEGVYARLMLALAGSGQQAAALEVFAAVRSRLADELGVEPGAELQDAQARVLRGELPAASPDKLGTAIRSGGHPTPAQLPADVPDFTGRDGQMKWLDALVHAYRDEAVGTVVIVVITGMPGVGKTALAVHWAHRAVDTFADGQLYVDLRGYAEDPPLDALQALSVLLAGLGVEASRIPADLEAAEGLYRSLLAGRRMLVVLDNASDARQVRPLLPGSPRCMAIITSRDRLAGLVATHGARRRALDVLTVGESAALLTQLLGEDRAEAEPEAVEALARACGLLPLALRIAAADLDSQPGATIADYLAGLQSGSPMTRLMVARDPQAAVRIAFDRSYRQLTADAQRLFRLLGLAPGPEISTPAAAALAAVTPEHADSLLTELADAHLAQPGKVRQGVRLHDLLRHYARECAEREDIPPERQVALGRLHKWYLQAVDAAARLLYPDLLRLPVPSLPRAAPMPEFSGPAAALAWLERERPNLVAAVQNAAARGPQSTACLLADTLRGYFWLTQHAVDWLVVARAGLTAAIASADTRGQAASQISLGNATAATGRYSQAIEHYAIALALARQDGWADGEAASLTELGLGHWMLGRPQLAADHHFQALDLYRQSGSRAGEATALLHLGVAHRYLGRLQEAAGYQTSALAIYRQLGARQGEAQALANLGVVDHELGQFDDARTKLNRALALLTEVGNRFGQAYVLLSLAAVHRDVGRHADALQAAEASMALATDIGHRYIQAAAGNILASIHVNSARYQQALRSYQRSLDLARLAGTRAAESTALLGLATVHEKTSQYSEACELAGQALAIANLAGLRILEGQAHAALAAAHGALGHSDQAFAHAKQALELHLQTAHRLGQARALRRLGLLLRDAGDAIGARARWEEAMELFTVIGSPEADDLRPMLEN